ncbi:hypothetical protein NDU88_002421 [Pleurodeles waltl]|uniref:Uncharacterized protein n=1 Tax=Pleurodeles waltl TaxID=8319 RepID=A0AAV7UAS6_PLEWA|nr:hypothetical protein NDU88_002421 [Pleurodeles waltl]
MALRTAYKMLCPDYLQPFPCLPGLQIQPRSRVEFPSHWLQLEQTLLANTVLLTSASVHHLAEKPPQ